MASTLCLWLHTVLTIVYLTLSNLPLAICYPLSSRSTPPIQQSGDVWAGVIANVAPLMALIGERNAKEHMRTASSWNQLLPLATAPIGILAIMVSAIRLSGSGFLRRLVGRDSERRSEVLVELTPLSVAPATSVFTSRAIEIEPSHTKDRVAFVCGHVKAIPKANSAVDAFRILIAYQAVNLKEDRDTETILAIWNRSLTLDQVALLASFYSSSTNVTAERSTCFDESALALLSYRTTGISPTQIATDVNSCIGLVSRLTDVLIALGFAFLFTGIQLLNFVYLKGSTSIFWLRPSGWSEIGAENQSLPSLFKDAYWSFSDSRHVEHRPTKGPNSNTLIAARPSSPKDRLQRTHLTSFSVLGLVGSYIIWYLSLRVAPWWVALSIGITWLAASYRAAVSRNVLTATKETVDNNEHWIGLIRNTLSESLLATVESAETQIRQQVRASTILCHVPSIRTALRTWSGAEDVMKVAQEMAKASSRLRNLKLDSQPVSGSKWLRVVRFRMATYFPCLVWNSGQAVDLAVTPQFDLESLIRHVVELLHICMDHEGVVMRYSIDSKAQLSHVLCGPIADPPVQSEFGSGTHTLRNVLVALRNNNTNTNTSIFSLEQTVLLPTIILACIYDRWLYGAGVCGEEIETLEKRHVDGLRLSGEAYLATIQDEIVRLGLWDDFTGLKNEANGEVAGELLPRDTTSGIYGIPNAAG